MIVTGECTVVNIHKTICRSVGMNFEKMTRSIFSTPSKPLPRYYPSLLNPPKQFARPASNRNAVFKKNLQGGNISLAKAL